ncbi:MAG: PIN domain-containing protein [Acidimicrobiia bacterium]|nr:PIN domain-containing protein [Acidimicrobiia bacterium]
MSFVVVYDANVLYPVELRDFLIRLANIGLFRAKWTDQILDETFGAIVANRPELAERLAGTRQQMDEAVADAIVTGYEPLVSSLDLPDLDDRHVLAAAIRSHAQVIVTFNLGDFPQRQLDPYDIEAQGPDEFALNVFGLAPALVEGVIAQQASDLTNPRISFQELLTRLETRGLQKLVQSIRECWQDTTDSRSPKPR